MRKISLLIIAMLIPAAVFAQQQGDVRKQGDWLQVWHQTKQQWISPEDYFMLEIERLKGPTYGFTKKYPPYDSTKEWETLIDVLPDGRVCPMVFFHSRWRRLPDVLALDERLRNYGGCRDVFKPASK